MKDYANGEKMKTVIIKCQEGIEFWVYSCIAIGTCRSPVVVLRCPYFCRSFISTISVSEQKWKR